MATSIIESTYLAHLNHIYWKLNDIDLDYDYTYIVTVGSINIFKLITKDKPLLLLQSICVSSSYKE